MIPFLLQAWMYASPVVYSIDMIPADGPWRLIYGLNPMTGVIQGFRWALLGSSPPDRLMVVSIIMVVARLISGLFYFRRMERWNEGGAPTMPPAGEPQPVNIDTFARAIKEKDISLVDTRMPQAFAGGHIPGSLNILLEGMTLFPGWLLDLEKPIWLVTERPEDAAVAGRCLARIGFDHVEGYLCGGFEKWQNRGLPIGHVGAISVDALKVMLEAGQIRVVDVREPDEWAEGIVPGAEPIFLGTMKDHLPAGSRDAPIASMCSVGHRGSMGASILRLAGFTNVYNVLGGTTAWKSRGYPLVKYLS
jgi:hydroxyacylglutathione hydrolase